MSLPFAPRPGQIVLFEKGACDITGSFICSQERDTNVCHAALLGYDGKIWTTGADFLKYGNVDAIEYLDGRKYHVAEFDTLSSQQVNLMMETCAAFTGQLYGFHKIAVLLIRARSGGIVQRLYPWLTETIKHPFCSEAVAAACWKAGYRICEDDGKEEPSAITPLNLYAWIQKKGTPVHWIYHP